MKIFVFGGTGFIGSALSSALINKGYEVIVFTRNAHRPKPIKDDKFQFVQWDNFSTQILLEQFKGEYGIVNLAGEPIGPKPWTKMRKRKILESRVTITQKISEVIVKANVKPAFVLQGSAVGFYGDRPIEKLYEQAPKGTGFMPDVVDQWEKALEMEIEFGIRVVYTRLGIVLGKNSGIFRIMTLPFRLWFGGYVGSGQQYTSWIHIRDVINAMSFLIEDQRAQGIYNLTAPNPLKMKDFSAILARKLKKPNWFHLPKFLLKITFGQMAEELLLASQEVYPERLVKMGFKFDFPTLGLALDEILKKD
ncbi:MAG: TIGR01777 family oxidoreductase [Bacteroidales bacterium]|nr:TIGR01777 family oxidoreductase [Bacteroidales bacterium]